MYQTNYMRRPPMQPGPYNNRFIGPGFIAPFLLGGLTGSLLTPSFYPRPYYRPYPYPYPPMYY